MTWSIASPRSILKTFGWKDENEVGTLIARKMAPGPLKKVITVKGKVQSYEEITITSQVSGEIKKLYCQEGDKVEKGQLLAEIDPKTLVEDLATTKSRLEQSKLALAGLRLRDQESQEKLQRSESLFSQGVLAHEEIQAARFAAAVTRTDIARARWQIREMEGLVASFDKKLGETRIRASRPGTVTRLIVKEGEGVIQGLVNTNGTAIMKISDLTQKGVTVWINEGDLPYLEAGQAAVISSPNFRGKSFNAHLSRIAMTGQAEQQTDLTKFEVKTLLNEPYPELLLEMSTVVSIEVGTREKILKLPITAIQTEEKKPGEEELAKKATNDHRHGPPREDISANTYQDFVYVIEEGKAVKRPVTTGLVNEQEAEIADGLKSGELAVIGPTKALGKIELGKPVTWEEEKAPATTPAPAPDPAKLAAPDGKPAEVKTAATKPSGDTPSGDKSNAVKTAGETKVEKEGAAARDSAAK